VGEEMIFNKFFKEDIEKMEGIEKGTLFASKNGYQTEIKYSEEDGCYYGKIENIDDLVNFEGDTYDDCLKAFYEAVEDYEHLKQDLEIMRRDASLEGGKCRYRYIKLQ
jgi:predicted HicB family RNase H-like nuclease